MFISITGELGSGKSTIAKVLERKYGFKLYSTGSIQREIAREKGMTTLELNKYMAQNLDNEYDKLIDNKTIEIAKNNQDDNIVFDSRMAWHFVESSFKVYVIVDKYIAANRVIMANRGIEENYRNIEDAVKGLNDRKKIEDTRFCHMYSVNITNYNNYNLIIDSSNIDSEKLADYIYCCAQQQKNTSPQIFLSPKRLFPTHVIEDINSSYIKELKNKTIIDPIEIVLLEDHFYIIDGHHRVCAQIENKIDFIPIVLLKVREDGIVEKYNKTLTDVINKSKISYYDWENYNCFQFSHYPTETKDITKRT